PLLETATFRSSPSHAVPHDRPTLEERRTKVQRGALLAAAFIGVILAAGAIGFGLSSFTQDRFNDSEARNDRVDSRLRATAPTSVAERPTTPPLLVAPDHAEAAPREPLSSSNVSPSSAASGALHPPSGASPGTIEEGKAPAPRAKEPPPKDSPRATETPSGVAA